MASCKLSSAIDLILWLHSCLTSHRNQSMDSVTGAVTPRGHTWSAAGQTLLDIRGDSLSIAENVHEEKAKAMEGNECEQEKQ